VPFGGWHPPAVKVVTFCSVALLANVALQHPWPVTVRHRWFLKKRPFVLKVVAPFVVPILVTSVVNGVPRLPRRYP